MDLILITLKSTCSNLTAVNRKHLCQSVSVLRHICRMQRYQLRLRRWFPWTVGRKLSINEWWCVGTMSLGAHQSWLINVSIRQLSTSLLILHLSVASLSDMKDILSLYFKSIAIDPQEYLSSFRLLCCQYQPKSRNASTLRVSENRFYFSSRWNNDMSLGPIWSPQLLC